MFASRAWGPSFLGAHDYRYTVTHVPGQNCYLCLRTVPNGVYPQLAADGGDSGGLVLGIPVRRQW